MFSNKIFSNYVSELDRFLMAYDKSHPGLSKSQQKEIAKAKRIYQLRDDPTASETVSKIWDEF